VCIVLEVSTDRVSPCDSGHSDVTPQSGLALTRPRTEDADVSASLGRHGDTQLQTTHKHDDALLSYFGGMLQT
jgi:hypothetical protein